MTAADRAEAADADLIAAWQGGDERAAAALVRRHTVALSRFLASTGARGDELEDLVQEAFFRAFRSIDRFRGQAAFRTWLLAIGGNVLKDQRRRAARRKVVPLLDHDVVEPSGDPHDHAVAGDVERRLEEALRRLPPMQRNVFLLRAQQGLEYDEIAGALGSTPGAARVHYHHAVRRLKRYVS